MKLHGSVSQELISLMVRTQQATSIDRGCMGLGLFQGTAGLAWAALTMEGKVPNEVDVLLVGA